MQVTINTISEVEQEADIQVPQEELQPHFERAYEEYRPKVEVRGFRKGRVPMPMIRQLRLTGLAPTTSPACVPPEPVEWTT